MKTASSPRSFSRLQIGLSVLVLTLAAIACGVPATPEPSLTPPPSPTPPPAATATMDPVSLLPPGTLYPGTTVASSTTADPDDDGQLEGIVLYTVPSGEGYGLVVESDSTVYHLGGPEPPVLFMEAPGSVKVYDHNGDGHSEVVVAGLLGIKAEVVNIFQWDGQNYRLFLELAGEDGILVEDDGTVTSRSDLPWAGYWLEKTAVWDGSAYRVRSHYGLLVALDDCLALKRAPSCVVVAFYKMLGEGDAATAHTLLGQELQAKVSPDELAERFGRLLTGLKEDSPRGDAGTVHVKVASEGAERNGTWSLRLEQEQWRLTDFQPGTAMPTLSPEGMLREILGNDTYAMAVPPGEDLLNWAAADLDGDGEDEVAVRTCPGSCDELGPDSVGRFRVLDAAEGLYTLSADLEMYFGFTFEPSFEVTQVRPDGGLGIVEQSPCGAHSWCLNLYTWDGMAYRAFSFSGSAMGVEVYPDGTVAVGNRDYFTDPISNGWTGVYRWDGRDYVLETVIFEGPEYEGAPGTVRAYYNAINVCVYEETFHPAYAYLSQDFQAAQPYDEFEAGFANTQRVDVEELTLVKQSAGDATVQVTITATDEVDGVEQETRYEITWQLTKEDDTWKLDQAQVQTQ